MPTINVDSANVTCTTVSLSRQNSNKEGIHNAFRDWWL